MHQNQWVKGVHTELLVVAEGMPVSTTQGLTGVNIALADIKLLVVQKYKMCARMASIAEQRQAQQTSNLQTGVIHEFFTNTETGVLEDLKTTPMVAVNGEG